MIHWFIKRMRRSMLLLGVPVMVSAFVLLNTAGSTQLAEQAENSDDGNGKTYEEVFSAVNPDDPADVYIQWDMPKAATGGESEQTDSACSSWFLGAYKEALANGRMDVSLCIVLDRAKLPANSLECVIHYFDAENSYLFVDLLDANGLARAENLYGNLLAGSGEDKVITLDVLLADYPDAAAIQLRYGEGNMAVYESRIYVEGYASSLAAAQELYGSHGSESAHNKIANDSSTVSSINPDTVQTAVSHDNLKEEDQFNPAQDTQCNTAINSISKAGIIFVDHITGDDQFSGCSPVICGQDGPKRTIRNGIATAGDGNNTLVIKSGAYNEDLDIKGRDVQVIVSGDVRL